MSTQFPGHTAFAFRRTIELLHGPYFIASDLHDVIGTLPECVADSVSKTAWKFIHLSRHRLSAIACVGPSEPLSCVDDEISLYESYAANICLA